jgi:hypothetical protein
MDPSANALILQIWRDGFRRVAPGDNAVLDGIMETSALLANDMLVFHRPTTRLLWEEFVSYAWDPIATLAGEDKPLKVGDHGPDAVRYGVRGSRNRWRPILHARARDAAA